MTIVPENSGISSRLLLFGATGDLAKRMLLPSLFALHEDGLIASDLRIVGTARSEMSDEQFRQLAAVARTKLAQSKVDQPSSKKLGSNSQTRTN